MTQQALAGLKVLEFGRSTSAAFAGKLMADYGAEVIKIEPPGTGDAARHHGPFPGDVPHPEKSGLFLTLNTNKLGVTLDPRLPAGRRIFLELICGADVLLEDFLPADLESWGLDSASLSKVNPRLIATSVTTFGKEGPNKGHKGYAITANAASGLSYRIGDPARTPLTTPLDRADHISGLYAIGATMLAVMAREATGRGQEVDIAAAESLASFIHAMDIFAFLEDGRYHTRWGRRAKMVYPWVILPCKDGFFSIITVQERHWTRFVEFMGNPEWSKNPRYQALEPMGKEYPQEVDDLILPWLSQQPRMELWAKCREARIPFHAVLAINDVLKSEQLNARGFWMQASHPDGGRWTYPGAPFKMSQTPWRLRCPAPRLGEHNDAIYCGRLGLSKTDLLSLHQAGIL